MGLLRALAKYFVKRRRGSIGETAKVMALTANNVCRAGSPATHDELLREVLRLRYSVIPMVSERRQEILVADTRKGLSQPSGLQRFYSLIDRCWELENGRPTVDPFAPNTVQWQAISLETEVIAEQLDKYLLPDTIKFLLRPPLSGITSENRSSDTRGTHDIQNGECRLCGCSQAAIYNFELICRPKSEEYPETQGD